MKFIVDRKTWYRGKDADSSRLLLDDGTRCCIGFVGQQVGIMDLSLRNKSVQSCPSSTMPFWPKWMTIPGGNSIQMAYLTNDDPEMSDETREAKLKDIFAAEGDEIEFVG